MKNNLFNKLIILLIILCIPTVFAKEILVDNVPGVYDDPTASLYFNEAENILVLNNYNGKNVLLYDFESDEEVTIILKGTNIISADNPSTEDSALGQSIFDTSTTAKISIKGENGSKLTISNYTTGIYSYHNDITIDNLELIYNGCDIEIDNLKDYAVHTTVGSYITITNSKLNISSSDYGVYIPAGSMSLKNVTYKSNDTQYSDIESEGKLIISDLDIVTINSEENMSEDHIVLAGRAIIADNITADFKRIYEGLYARDKVEVTNSNIKGNIVYDALIISEDSSIVVKDSTIDYNLGNTGMYADYNIKIDNTKINMIDVGFAIVSGEDIEIIGNEITLINKDEDALAIAAIVSNDGNIYINAKLKVDYNLMSSNIMPTIMSAQKVEFENATADIKSDQWGIMALDSFAITESEVSIEATTGPALVVVDTDKKSFNKLVVLNNTVLKETKPIFQTTFYNTPEQLYISGYFDTEVEEISTNVLGLIDASTRELHFTYAPRITFDPNGGNGIMQPIYITGEKQILPAVAFASPSGKVFKGWSQTPTGEQLINDIIATKDTKIYAIWEDGIKTETEYIEVEKEVIKEVEVIREVEVPKEVIKKVKEYIEVEKEVIKEVEVPKEVIKEVIKEVEVPADNTEELAAKKKFYTTLIIINGAIGIMVIGYIICKFAIK